MSCRIDESASLMISSVLGCTDVNMDGDRWRPMATTDRRAAPLCPTDIRTERYRYANQLDRPYENNVFG
jgi:hypothetical protein